MYNKEEVMKAFDERYSDSEVDGHLMKSALRENHRQFLSTALDAAYKAGRESMYQAGGKACKKVYQNHKEDHLCRFNDGEQNCNCYLSGINEVIVALEALK